MDKGKVSALFGDLGSQADEAPAMLILWHLRSPAAEGNKHTQELLLGRPGSGAFPFC